MDVRRQLAQWDLRPSKGLGQSFLVDPVVLGRIADTAELTREDVVLEVGPGLGGLTLALARQAGRVVAVELDDRLLGPLRGAVSSLANVTLVHGDILELDPSELIQAPSERYKVVANLPYYITSAVLRHLLEARLRPGRIVVTVQREVAERIVAGPGAMSLLALSIQYFGEPRIAFRIKPGSFYPPPEVESAVVRIDLRPDSRTAAGDSDGFFRVARAGFSQRRKQLRNALSAGLGVSPGIAEDILEAAGVDGRRRAQSLSLEEWTLLARSLAEQCGDSGGDDEVSARSDESSWPAPVHGGGEQAER